ncbi:MAG: deoxynucleoside kinase [Planctomycetes bacterium]|nr:deoxynucleoside kinase [Planctomycetota bacterium]
MFIGISGIIGAGKTTLTTQLAEHFGCRAYFEPVVENAYLADFYQDMKRWGAMMQLYLLAKRFEQHQQLVWCGEGAVQDRTIYEDTIFARMLRDAGLIDERDYATYISHFNIMKRFLVYPDVILYLRVEPERAMQRIAKRGRSMEQGITLEYLERLADGYEQYASEMNRWTRVLTLDWNAYGSTAEVARLVTDEISENLQFLRDLKRV